MLIHSEADKASEEVKKAGKPFQEFGLGYHEGLECGQQKKGRANRDDSNCW